MQISLSHISRVAHVSKGLVSFPLRDLIRLKISALTREAYLCV